MQDLQAVLTRIIFSEIYRYLPLSVHRTLFTRLLRTMKLDLMFIGRNFRVAMGGTNVTKAGLLHLKLTSEALFLKTVDK